MLCVSEASASTSSVRKPNFTHRVKPSTWLTDNPKGSILWDEIPLSFKHGGLYLVAAGLWSLWKAG